MEEIMLTQGMKKVIVALRSGRFTQGREMLETPEGNLCCLGVMCKVYQEEMEPEKSQGRLNGGCLNGRKEVQEWVGLTDQEGETEKAHSLIELNDTYDYTFKQIADYIESEPKGLLKNT